MVYRVLGRYVLFEVLLLLVLFGLALYLFTYQLRMVSATYDEAFSYVANGEYVIKHLRWDRPYTTLHPPLFYYLHGWSALTFPTQDPGERLLIARLSLLPIYIVFGLLIFALLRAWYGRLAGFSGLVLYLFNPEILAHARLVTPDHPLALAIFLALITLYKALTTSRLLWWVAFGGALGASLLIKYSALLLIPLTIVLTSSFALWNRSSYRKTAAGLGMALLIALSIVHAGYLFKETALFPAKFESTPLKRIARTSFAPLVFMIIPRAYLAGVDLQLHESQKGVWWGFFNGNYYTNGLWYYYPVVFLIKTPLPLLTLIILAVVILILKKTSGDRIITYGIAITIFWFFLYFMFFNRLIIGLRYLLMIYPLLFVLVARVVVVPIAEKKHRYMYRTFLIILFSWYMAGTVRIAPFYLAFTNELTGGPKDAWKYLADSSLDWNQDREFFTQYLRRHPEVTAVNPRRPTAGIIAVNVNEMNLYYYRDYQWLRRLQKDPVDWVGYTWLIFDITDTDILSTGPRS